MHGIGAHSAVAIKRQRRRREQALKKGYRQPKSQTQAEVARQQRDMSNKVMGTITMFHVGAVFLTVGLFLLLAAVITNETNQAEIAELIGTGVICLVIGLFLVILNRFYGKKEEEELHNYVESRLARTQSGQRLYHDADSIPEHLDANAGSRTPSIESDLNAGNGNNSKNKGKKKKNIPGPGSGSGSGHGSHSQPIVSVSVINERHHNQNQNQKSPNPSSRGEISSGGVGVNLQSSSSDRDRDRNLYRVYNSTTTNT